MDKSLVIFVIKYFVLFVFVFLVFFVLSFGLKNLKSVKDTDKNYLLLLIYAGSAISVGLMVYYAIIFGKQSLTGVLLIFIISLIVAFLIFALWLAKIVLRLVFVFNNRLKEDDIVRFNNEFYRFLGFYKDYVILEDFDGKVIQLSIKSVLNQGLQQPGDKIWFYISQPMPIELVSKRLEENPYLTTDRLAAIEEEDLATREKRIKICAKGKFNFKDLKQLKKYIEAGREQG